MVMTKKCPNCAKVIESLYKNQLEYNYSAHKLSCIKKTKLLDKRKVRDSTKLLMEEDE